MASTRRLIQEELIKILGTIKKVDGYNNDVVKVTKRLKTVDRITSFPECSVLIGGSIITAADQAEKQWKVVIVYGLIGYVKSDTDTDDTGRLSDAANDLIEDMEEAVLSSTTLIDNVAALAHRYELQAEEPFLDYQNNFAQVQVNLGVWFYHGSDV